MTFAAFAAVDPTLFSKAALSSTGNAVKSAAYLQSSTPFAIVNSSPTALNAIAPAIVSKAQCLSGATNYFSSIRTPASLIAGTALGLLFSISKSRDPQLDKWGYRFQFVYHVLALASLLLALNTIIISTSAANTLMIGEKFANTHADSVYHFLTRDMQYQFVMTRWSFFTALFNLLPTILIKALLEFDLLHKKKLRSALLLAFPVLSLLFHSMSVVNENLVCWPNIGAMTVALAKLYYKRAVIGWDPLEMLALLCQLGTAGLIVTSFFGKKNEDDKDVAELLN